jgi:2-keto-4-pentenoate hydratase/2-oxohepta-3-ene-1,7-dioic acid hydratase in catechol pathway
VQGDRVLDVTTVLAELPLCRWPAPAGDALVAALANLRPRIEAACGSAASLKLESVSLLSPVARPARVIAVRTNYRGDDPPSQRGSTGAAPDLFLKSATSISGPSAGVELRLQGRRTDHEIELAVVIGRRTDRVEAADALDAVAGYCIGIDFTLRGDEDRGLRKSLDGYMTLGPWLTTPDEAGRIEDLGITLSVNGAQRQAGRTADMVHSVGEIIACASRYFPLLPGDVLLTGTPPGAGPVEPGDVLHCSIENLGEMSVAVRSAHVRGP